MSTYPVLSLMSHILTCNLSHFLVFKVACYNVSTSSHLCACPVSSLVALILFVVNVDLSVFIACSLHVLDVCTRGNKDFVFVFVFVYESVGSFYNMRSARPEIFHHITI